MKTATPCAHRPCRRITKDSSGRCHDHRVGSVASASRVLLGPVLEGAKKTTSTGLGHEYVIERGELLLLPSDPPEGYRRVGTPVKQTELYSSADAVESIEYFEEPDGEYPVRVVIRERGMLVERHLRNGKPYRADGGPTEVIWNDDGALSEERWQASTKRGPLHRTDGPAAISYYPDGAVLEESYYRDGRNSRIEGPAYIAYREDGSVWSKAFVFRGTNSYVTKEFYDSVGKASVEELRKHFVGTPLEVVPRGREHDAIAALGAGVTTADGVLEMLNGSPVEWVIAYEEGRS